MSSQNEISELRGDIKEQTKEIANLTTSITQLVESYKWIGNINFALGVDGLSFSMVLLNAIPGRK